MNAYYQDALEQKKMDYRNLVIPNLKKLGYRKQEADNLFNTNQIRIRWGKDWNEFTVHMTNPLNEPTWEMDDLIHLIWGKGNIPNRIIITCFIKNRGVGPVLSLAITDLHTLANGMKKHGVIRETKNSFNGQTFMTLPFSHHSLSNNIWGIGIKSV